MKKIYILEYKGALHGLSGERAGMPFDLTNACPGCGTGAQFIGDLVTKGINHNKLSKKDFIITYDNDYLISTKVYQALIAESAKFKTTNVIDKTGHMLPFYQITSDYYFPKLLPVSKGIQPENQCPTCRRDGHFGVLIRNYDNSRNIWAPMEFVYSISDKSVLEKTDVFYTWEHFSNSVIHGRGPFFARPLLLVSELVKTILEKQKIRNMFFTKVQIR